MGAMENWGLITYRTTAVLFDEGKSDNRYRNRIAYVVAHGKFKFGESVTIYLIYCYYLFLFLKALMISIELAHQWFGNLVTMDWWNELWLNEGFATWVGWLAVDHFYPGKSRSLNRSSSYS
jgi:aminopeptidase N